MTNRIPRRRFACLAAALSFLSAGTTMSRGDDDPVDPDAPKASTTEPLPNFKTPTLGGRQYWGDVTYFRGWRIQHNVVTGHYRLIDPEDMRHAWGAEDACQAALEQIKNDQELQPMTGRAVILVHGIIRSSKSFAPMQAALAPAYDEVIGFDYPSTRITIQESTEYLHKVIQSLEGIERIDFVVHSMGGLLLRTYLAEYGNDPRFGRLVMLGVPNQGARMANVVENNLLYKWIFGPAGQQLTENEESYAAGLPTPEFEFAIVAGARGEAGGWNPLIPGDDDGTVDLVNTRLPGASDSMTVKCLHSFLPRNDAVIKATVHFLDTGRLLEEGDPAPIPLQTQPE